MKKGGYLELKVLCFLSALVKGHVENLNFFVFLLKEGIELIEFFVFLN